MMIQSTLFGTAHLIHPVLPAVKQGGSLTQRRLVWREGTKNGAEKGKFLSTAFKYLTPFTSEDVHVRTITQAQNRAETSEQTVHLKSVSDQQQKSQLLILPIILKGFD